MSDKNYINYAVAGEILGGFDNEDGDPSESTGIKDYQNRIDPKLVNAGWGFKPAKSVEHGKIDQSLVNHVRCGVFALDRLNELVSEVSGYTLSDEELRDTIALFVLHDIHKIDEERDTNPKARFDIPREEVEQYADQFGLYEFAGTNDVELLERMFHDCAIDHHDDWTANYDQTSPEFDELRPFVRLADAIASSEPQSRRLTIERNQHLMQPIPARNSISDTTHLMT
jgi:CRISPR-associated protein Csc3